jgi:hypothetical protein
MQGSGGAANKTESSVPRMQIAHAPALVGSSAAGSDDESFEEF